MKLRKLGVNFVTFSERVFSLLLLDMAAKSTRKLHIFQIQSSLGFVLNILFFLLHNLDHLAVILRISKIGYIVELEQVRLLVAPIVPHKYSVSLSVLDPKKCEYLKDYSLDFEHAYMTTYLAS